MNDRNDSHAAPLSPFSTTFTQTIPELILTLNITLAVSIYQAGKVIFISAADVDQLIQLPRNFHRAMGMAVSGRKLAIAAHDETVILANAPGLSRLYPKQPGAYDGFFVPRASYYTGPVDIHELAWGNEGLWAVNTAFSCL